MCGEKLSAQNTRACPLKSVLTSAHSRWQGENGAFFFFVLMKYIISFFICQQFFVKTISGSFSDKVMAQPS